MWVTGVAFVVAGLAIILWREFEPVNGYSKGAPMSFGIYIVGYIILIVGLAMGAHLLHMPQKWMVVGIVCLVGMAIIHGVTATRQKDPPSN